MPDKKESVMGPLMVEHSEKGIIELIYYRYPTTPTYLGTQVGLGENIDVLYKFKVHPKINYENFYQMICNAS